MKNIDMGQLKNAGGGLLIAGIGLFFFMKGQGLDMGTLRNMGPGMFPNILSIVTMVSGLIIAVYDFCKSSDLTLFFDLKGVLSVSGAFAIFAFFLESAGIFISVSAAVLVVAFAQPTLKKVETAIMGVALFLFVWVVFSLGLGMPIYMLPEVFR
jgi:putative tricarboxylic transport membrane protein